MENSSRAFLDAVGSNVIDPKLLTYAEKRQLDGYCADRKPTKPFSAWTCSVPGQARCVAGYR